MLPKLGTMHGVIKSVVVPAPFEKRLWGGGSKLTALPSVLEAVGFPCICQAVYTDICSRARALSLLFHDLLRLIERAISVLRHGIVYVKRKAGQLPYAQDPKAIAALSARSHHGLSAHGPGSAAVAGAGAGAGAVARGEKMQYHLLGVICVNFCLCAIKPTRSRRGFWEGKTHRRK